MTSRLNRRKFVACLFAAGGGLGLRSMLLGLPRPFLLNRAMAAPGAENFLLFSSARSGDPINANAPGSYVTGVDHATEFTSPVTFMLGDQAVSGAAPWANLSSDFRARLQFIHHASNSSAHTESAKVLKINGTLRSENGNGVEMLPSAIAQHLSPRLGTVMEKPIAIGKTKPVPISYRGIPQTPLGSADLASLASNDVPEELKNMMAFRDSQLDALYGELKGSGTPSQRNFLDQHVKSRDQARQLSGNLEKLLEDARALCNDDPDPIKDELIAAVAILASRTAPVAVLNLPFGGDNHNDPDLVREVTQTESSIQNIECMWNMVKGLGIGDKTTFALLNVFGRTLKTNQSGGRDHNRHHSVMLLAGPCIKGGVTGGLVVNSEGVGEATGINSSDGSSNNPDIPKEATLSSAAKTMMKSCGLTNEEISTRLGDKVESGRVVESVFV